MTAEVAASPIQQTADWDALFQHAYDLYFMLFALAAVLLLAAVFWPKRRNAFSAPGMFIFLLLLAVSHQTSIDQRRGFIADQERRYEAALKKLAQTKSKEEVLRTQYLYMPAGNSLLYLTLGNPSIAADYVWLTSLQYVSNAFRRGEKFEMLARFYRTMVELNPHWIEAEINGGKVLSALEPDRFKVEQCYILAIRANPDDWRLPREAGDLFVVAPENPAQQAEYSRHAVEWYNEARDKAIKAGDVPRETLAMIKDKIARLGLESGAAFYELAADALKENALDLNAPPALRDRARGDWLKAHSLLLVSRLQERVDAFKQAHGHWPESLDEVPLPLLGGGVRGEGQRGAGAFLDEYDFPIEYTPATGTVWSRGVNAFRAIQATRVIAELTSLYAGEHGGKFPPNLAALRDFVRRTYKDAPTPPSALVVAALGPELDPTAGPLGPWDYNPATGQINLPKECNAKALYRNAYLKFGLPVP